MELGMDLDIFKGDGPEKVYHDALQRGEFLIQRCNSCSGHIFFPRVICTHCGSSDIEWVKPSGKGTVYSTTTLRRKAEKGGPLNVCLIDLAEGPRMMSRVEGIDADKVTIGMQVTASVIHDQDRNVPLVVFRPAGEQS
jgi:uncharacterized OB-fold protein